MICKRCGDIIDGKHECTAFKELIVSEHIKISEDDSIPMQDIFLELPTPKDSEEITREEIVVVGFGITVAVFFVGITILNVIF